MKRKPLTQTVGRTAQQNQGVKMNIPCKVCQSEEAVNPQSEYPVCETCAVDFYETVMTRAAQQGGQSDECTVCNSTVGLQSFVLCERHAQQI